MDQYGRGYAKDKGTLWDRGDYTGNAPGGVHFVYWHTLCWTRMGKSFIPYQIMLNHLSFFKPRRPKLLGPLHSYCRYETHWDEGRAMSVWNPYWCFLLWWAYIGSESHQLHVSVCQTAAHRITAPGSTCGQSQSWAMSSLSAAPVVPWIRQRSTDRRQGCVLVATPSKWSGRQLTPPCVHLMPPRNPSAMPQW